MEIYAANQKLTKLLASEKKLIRKHGAKMAAVIMQRIDDLRMCDNLSQVFDLSGNHHPLVKDRKGTWACHLTGNYRLIYTPANEPLPLKENNELIYEQVTEIIIVDIRVDYH